MIIMQKATKVVYMITDASVMSGLAMFIVNFLAFVMVAVLLYRKELSEVQRWPLFLMLPTLSIPFDIF